MVTSVDLFRVSGINLIILILIPSNSRELKNEAGRNSFDNVKHLAVVNHIINGRFNLIIGAIHTQPFGGHTPIAINGMIVNRC